MVCVECGHPIACIYKEYSKGNIRLTRCVSGKGFPLVPLGAPALASFLTARTRTRRLNPPASAAQVPQYQRPLCGV